MSVASLSLRFLVVGSVAVGAFWIGRSTAHPDLLRPETTALSKGIDSAASDKNVAANVSEPLVNNAEDAARLAKLVAHSRGSIHAEEEQQTLIEKWAAKDPHAAMEFAKTQLKGDRQAQAISSILAVWGKNDPASAWTWVQTEMPTATHHFDTLLEVFGRNSPATAARFAAEYSSTHPAAALEVHLAALLGITYNGDFSGARSLVEGNTSLDPAVRATLDNFIAGQWARFAPTEAAAWVMSLPAGPLRDQALMGLGESWSDVDPAQATTFAVNLPSGEARTLALRQSISKWVMTDPVAARNWVLNTDRHEDFDQAVQAVATETNLMSREPSRAILWAAGIFDNNIRLQTQSTILFNWYAIDPTAATTYLQSSPDFTVAQRDDLLKKLHPSG